MTKSELEQIKLHYARQKVAGELMEELLKAGHIDAAALAAQRLALEAKAFEEFLQTLQVEGELAQTGGTQRPSQDSPTPA